MKKRRFVLIKQLIPYSTLLLLVVALGGIIAIANRRQSLPRNHQGRDYIAYSYNRYLLSKEKRIKEPLRITADEERLLEGYELYQTHCARCHLPSGQGKEKIPPLWGEEAFSSRDQLAHPKELASFIQRNMPLIGPRLSEEESLKIAEYILSRPRPDHGPETAR